MTSRLLDALTGGERPGLWLDGLDYARRVLLSGREIPWLRTAELASFHRQAYGLLRPSVVTLPVERVVSAWLDANPAAAGALAGKSRTGFALKKLLADEDLRAVAEDVVSVLRRTHPEPFALVLPAPGEWLAAVHARVNGSRPPEVSVDDADGAAMVVADWLRTFSGVGCDGVLFDDGREALSREDGEAYAPVVNVARHYRWTLGICTDDPEAGGIAPDFRIGHVAGGTAAFGFVLPAAFWDGADPPVLPAGAFYVARIPEPAAPEAVLERLGTLR